MTITFWLYRWRRLILNNEAVLVPEKWGAVIQKQTESHQQMVYALSDILKGIEMKHQETWTSLGDLNQTIEALRSAVSADLMISL